MRSKFEMGFGMAGVFFATTIIIFAMYLMATRHVHAQGPTYTIINARSAILDTPTLSLTTATADTTATPTTGMHHGQFQITFGTVSGTYTTCTAQAKTSIDGTNYLTLGSAVTLTVTSNTVNAWDIIEQLGTTSVTSSAVSSSVALTFGRYTKLTVACSGAYGNSAPATVSVNFH